jgi:hypothetical protein
VWREQRRQPTNEFPDGDDCSLDAISGLATRRWPWEEVSTISFRARALRQASAAWRGMVYDGSCAVLNPAYRFINSSSIVCGAQKSTPRGGAP